MKTIEQFSNSISRTTTFSMQTEKKTTHSKPLSTHKIWQIEQFKPISGITTWQIKLNIFIFCTALGFKNKLFICVGE